MHKIIKYGLLILKDGKFLVNREYGEKHFLMLGGKPTANESAEDCLCREVSEEIGCNVMKDSLKFIGNFEDVAINEKDTMVEVRLYLGSVEGEIRPNEEIEEVRWLGTGDDMTWVSPLIVNKIIPGLVQRGILK